MDMSPFIFMYTQYINSFVGSINLHLLLTIVRQNVNNSQANKYTSRYVNCKSRPYRENAYGRPTYICI